MTTLAQQRTWEITESPFNPVKLYHSETIFTIGNGNMGVRGTFEEGYEGQPEQMVSTLVHGLFDHARGELVPELVNLPNPLGFGISLYGEPFDLTKGRILGYRRTLDLQTAKLRREVLWRSGAGKIVQIRFERFASLETDALLVQRIQIRPLNGQCQIGISASIDGGVTNEGVNHWASLECGSPSDSTLYVRGQTAQSGYVAVVASRLVADVPGQTLSLHTQSVLPRPALRADFVLEKEQQATFYKFTAIHTSRDSADPLAAALQTLNTAQARGYDGLYAGHCAEWAKYWHDSGIEIDGDEVAQRAIRFTTYHVLIAAPRNEERSSIGAKTLSGPGYKGHVFWDTELFMLPLLTLTQPKLARNLLMYRYHNLPGARRKAAVNGYEGAMYPWESTDTGEETTPQWTNPMPDGTRIRIWTGDTEQHISTDIAYAVMQYWRWTGEDDWFASYGAEIVLDTAVFWGSRVEYNAAQDRFELPMQIGPDEYHENINNSAFTNSMVRWHLRTALEVRGWLRKTFPTQADSLLAKLHIDDTRTAHWQQVIDKMYIPRDAQRGIIEQFDGFMKLEPLNLALWQPRVANMDWILGHAPTQRTMVIKQADIVMLMALLGDEFGSIEERRKHWDFYYPLVDHGSSLSPSTHTWVAARLGLDEEAYKLLMFAGGIDLDDLKGNVRDGIHAAAAGGLWQALVFGFAGLSLADGQTKDYRVDPKLPRHWRSMKFRIMHCGQQKEIVI